MKTMFRFTRGLLILVLVAGCSRSPAEVSFMPPMEGEAPVETLVVQPPEATPPSLGTIPRSDLVTTSLSIMDGNGVTHTVLDTVPMVLVQQGATMIVSTHVFIDNTLSGGEDSFDRDAIEFRLLAQLVNAGDVIDPNAETSYEDVIEYDDYPPTESEGASGYLVYQPPVVMDNSGVQSGLRENGLLNADKYSFPDNFDTVESLSDHLLAEKEPSQLMASDPEIVENLMLEQLPRLRYFNAGGVQGVNNHLMPIQQYAVDYVVGAEDYERHTHWVVFTFEIGTGALANGDWELSVQVDHNNEILEADESNNTLFGAFTIHPSSTDWASEFDTWWEDHMAEGAAVCDPWRGETAPTKFDTQVTRVRHYIGKHPWYRESPNLGFWADQGMANVLRTQMYVTEFWGPYGGGRKYIDGNWVEYYDDMGGDFPRPAPEDVENVFLFLAGNNGCRAGSTSIATGQDNYLCNFTGTEVWKHYELRIESWAGQLVYKQPMPQYSEIYSPTNSLLAMAFQHVGTAGYSSRVQRQNAEGFVDYLIDRTEGFKNVRNVWLGGNSRGGAIAVRLARIIKRRMVEGDPSIQASADMRIIVTAADAVTLHDRDDLYYHSMRYICRGSICYDANTHELDRVFPFSSDPERDYTSNLFVYQAVGPSGGLDSMVQYRNENYTNWRNWVITEGLPGNFYTQNMEGFENGLSHKEMCRTWKQITAINHIQFFFRKAIDDSGQPWDLNFIPYPDGCP